MRNTTLNSPLLLHSVFTLVVLVAVSACMRAEAADTAHRSELPVADWQGAEQFQTPSDGALREELTDLQYRVTQHDATERPFSNAYWDNKRAGIYVDIVSGEPLFSSTDKYKSGTGWPSFVRPLESDHVVEDTDYKLGYARTEVRSKHADSHLGHLFPDGPKPTGLRYCINSAAIQFIPLGDLEARGYGQYLESFEDGK